MLTCILIKSLHLINISICFLNNNRLLKYVLVSHRAIIKVLQTWRLKQQKLNFSQFWRPDIWNQGVGRAVFPPKALVEKKSALPPPASGSTRGPWLGLLRSSLCLCLHAAFSSMSVSSLFSLKKILISGFRAHLGNLDLISRFQCNYTCKDFFPKRVPHS